MIEERSGDIFEAGTEAIVNPVNCQGAMGRGLALAMKLRFPEVYQAYREAWRAGELRPGKMHVTGRDGGLPPRLPRFVINFPTKDRWAAPSRLEWIEAGMRDLVRVVKELEVDSIAIPPLGCGLGGLRWAQVRPLVVRACEGLDEVLVVLYAPGQVPGSGCLLGTKERGGTT